MRVGSIAIRAVLPFEANETATLTTIDTHSLVSVARVGGIIPGIVPCECGIGKFNFGWDFFRVTSTPRFLILGRESDGWMNRRATVRVRVASPGRRLKMMVDLPGWMPRQYPVAIRASLNDEIVSQLSIDIPGRHELSIPLDKQGDIQVEIDHCGDPKDAPANDKRAFCYWLASTEEQ
jgi:hypothetical protein